MSLSSTVFFAALAVAVTLVGLRADGPLAAPAPLAADSGEIRRLFAGRWSLQERRGEVWFSSLFTYREDGTFSGEFSHRIGQERGMRKSTGTWQIEGNKLSYRANPSSEDQRTLRCTMPVDSIILSITAGEFRFIDENGDERLAKRTEAKEPDEPPATMGYSLDRLALYQPDEVMAARVSDVTQLAAYVKALESVCSQFFASSDQPAGVDVVVAVRPGQRSKTWVDWKEAGVVEREALRKQLEAVVPVEVKGGPVAFALIGKTGGGLASSKADKKTLPMPKEWGEAAAGSEKPLRLPDDILAEIWPEEK